MLQRKTKGLVGFSGAINKQIFKRREQFHLELQIYLILKFQEVQL